MFKNFFFYYVITWKKYLRAGQTTDNYKAHGHCMLDM